MSHLHLTNLRMLDVREGALKSGFTVTIQGDRIASVSDQPVREGDGEVIDLGGRVLMPGLIDCHVHVNAVQLNLGGF